MKNIILDLTVRDHHGVMSHVSGLFARRAYNIEGILCGKLKDAVHSRMFLMIKESERLDTMLKQIGKLEDVIDVSVHEGYAGLIFDQLKNLCNNKSSVY